MTTAADSGPASKPLAWQLRFLERATALGDVTGFPPSFLQVFAWLIVCEPPEQSARQLQAVLGLSAGAISAATKTLCRMGMAERVSQPGRRQLSYRVTPGAWERVLRLRLEATSTMRAIVDDAVSDAPDGQSRLAEMRTVYAEFEGTLERVLSRWRQED